MFTSRAEYRLRLREDNADVRLTEVGRELGVVDDARWDAFSRKRDLVSRETRRLAGSRPESSREDRRSRKPSLLELLRRPGMGYDALLAIEPSEDGVSRETLRRDHGRTLADQAIEQIEVSAKYAGYVTKQDAEGGQSSPRGGNPVAGGLRLRRGAGVVVRGPSSAGTPASHGSGRRVTAAWRDTGRRVPADGASEAASPIRRCRARRRLTVGRLIASGPAARATDADLATIIAEGAGQLELNLDGARIDRLVAYLRLIERWNATYNLTAVRDVRAMATQHVVDCLAAIPTLRTLWRSDRRQRVLDVGSGAGLPGVVVAIVHAEIEVLCVEQRGQEDGFHHPSGSVPGSRKSHRGAREGRNPGLHRPGTTSSSVALMRRSPTSCCRRDICSRRADGGWP